jgi:hypothetical protein
MVLKRKIHEHIEFLPSMQQYFIIYLYSTLAHTRFNLKWVIFRCCKFLMYYYRTPNVNISNLINGSFKLVPTEISTVVLKVKILCLLYVCMYVCVCVCVCVCVYVCIYIYMQQDAILKNRKNHDRI